MLHSSNPEQDGLLLITGARCGVELLDNYFVFLVPQLMLLFTLFIVSALYLPVSGSVEEQVVILLVLALLIRDYLMLFNGLHLVHKWRLLRACLGRRSSFFAAVLLSFLTIIADPIRRLHAALANGYLLEEILDKVEVLTFLFYSQLGFCLKNLAPRLLLLLL